MAWLGKRSDTVFIGQGVRFPGPMYTSLDGVRMEKRLEWPVAEEFQLGASIGISLQGFTVISLFPRWNFLICAANQLVNHLDRIPMYSGYRPKVIVRVGVGSSKPLDPGPQHSDDFSDFIRGMLRTVQVRYLCSPEKVLPTYQEAYLHKGSTLIVENFAK